MHSPIPLILLTFLGLASSSPTSSFEHRDEDIPPVNIPDLFDGSLGELPTLWLMTQASYAELQAEHERVSRFGPREETQLRPNAPAPRVETTRGHDGVVYTTTMLKKKREVVTEYVNAPAPTNPVAHFVIVTVTGEPPVSEPQPTSAAEPDASSGSSSSRSDKENASAFASFLSSILIPNYFNIKDDGLMKGLCKSIISSASSMTGSVVTQEMTKDLYGADTTASEFEQGLISGLFFGGTVKEGASAALTRNICKRVIPDFQSLWDLTPTQQKKNMMKLAPKATRGLLRSLLRRHGMSKAVAESAASDIDEALRIHDHIKHPIKTAKNFEKNLQQAKKRLMESMARGRFPKEKTYDAFRNLIRRTSKELGHGSPSGLTSNDPIDFLKSWSKEHSKTLKKIGELSKKTGNAFKNLGRSADKLASKLRGVCHLRKARSEDAFLLPRNLDERRLSCADELMDAARGAQHFLDKVNPWSVDDAIKDGIDPTNHNCDPPEPPEPDAPDDEDDAPEDGPDDAPHQPAEPAEPVEPPYITQPPQAPPIQPPQLQPPVNPVPAPPQIYVDEDRRHFIFGPGDKPIYVGSDGLPLPVPVPVPVKPQPPQIYLDGQGNPFIKGPDGKPIYVGPDGLPLPVPVPVKPQPETPQIYMDDKGNEYILGPNGVPVPVSVPVSVPVPVKPDPAGPIHYNDNIGGPGLDIYTDSRGNRFFYDMNGKKIWVGPGGASITVPAPVPVPNKNTVEATPDYMKYVPKHWKKHRLACQGVGHSWCAWLREEARALCKDNKHSGFQVRIVQDQGRNTWSHDFNNWLATPHFYDCTHGDRKKAAKMVERECQEAGINVFLGADNMWW